MHASYFFVVVPVAIVLVASASSASASPTTHVNMKHHVPAHNHTRVSRTAHAANSTRRTRVKHVMTPRSLNVLGLYLGELTSDHDGILSASDAFSDTAKKARSQPAGDNSYHQEAAAGLTTYRHSLDPLQSLLVRLAAEKGLANYDKSNKYETLLKDIVNASKYTLRDTDDIIEADPLLGPILGPIVYEIKCILDELLDATENITDGILNSLAPLLKPVILSATGTVCRNMSPPVLGLCLPL